MTVAFFDLTLVNKKVILQGMLYYLLCARHKP